MIRLLPFLLGFFILLGASNTWADEPAGEEATTYQQVVPGSQSLAAQETNVTGGTLMIIAYFILWGLLLAYIVVLAGRQRSLDQDIESLEKRLDELAGLHQKNS